jgi:hypothetical protein
MIAPFEYWTQRRALERLGHEPPSARTARRELVVRARQKKDAAEAVAPVSLAESLVLMRDSVILFEKAVNEVGADQTFLERCAYIGVDAKTARRLEATLAGLAERSLPVIDADVSEADVEFFSHLAEAAAVLNRALSPTILQKGDIVSRRLKRGLVTTLVGVATALALYLGFRPLPCQASGFLLEEYKCEMAVDGVVATEWLLPDGKDGWLDMRVSPRRAIHLVRVLNGHNRTSNDRAIRGYRLEAYSGDRLLQTASGEFPGLLPAPTPVDVPLVAKGVDRLRIVVTSWYGGGAALAEIKVE